MDLSQLKNTSDEQFEKDVSFHAELPDGTETDIVLTIKSVRNEKIKPKFAKLYNEQQKESAKLQKPKITDEQSKAITDKITAIDVQICDLVLVKFAGLQDGDKPYPCNEKTKQDLVRNYGWIRQNIVNQAIGSDAFYQG